MKAFESITEILDFAIAREQEAVDFYIDLMKKTDNPTLQKVFDAFSAVERGHKLKLQMIKTRDVQLVSNQKNPNLKIADYLVDIQPGPDMTFQEALMIAMKREKAAMDLYNDLAERVSGEFQELFLGLANEEAGHKLRFESEYEDHFLFEN